MAVPTLCEICGAYWGCEHHPESEEDKEPEEQPRYSGIIRAFYKKNVEIGTLPQSAYDFFYGDKEKNPGLPELES